MLCLSVKMKGKGSMSQNLEDLHEKFIPLATSLIDLLKKQNVEYCILWTARSGEQQEALYLKGQKAVANGFFSRNRAGNSFHNYGMAIDIAPAKEGKITLDDQETLKKIVKAALELDLEWGGRFSPPEPYHFQIKGKTIELLKTRGGQPKVDYNLLTGMIDGSYP